MAVGLVAATGPAGNGPGVFEAQVAALDRQIRLATFGKLSASAETHSTWPEGAYPRSVFGYVVGSTAGSSASSPT